MDSLYLYADAVVSGLKMLAFGSLIAILCFLLFVAVKGIAKR